MRLALGVDASPSASMRTLDGDAYADWVAATARALVSTMSVPVSSVVDVMPRAAGLAPLTFVDERLP